MFFLIAFLGNLNIYGQGVPSGSSTTKTDPLGDKNFAFLPIPYFNYDRSLEFQFGALPMAMYRLNPKDTISPASITGLFGMYTSNDSWFAMFFQQFYLSEDNWRITAAGGHGSINFQFYIENPMNRFFKYNTGANFIYLMGQRRVVSKLYVGLSFVYADLTTNLKERPAISIDPTTLTGMGIVTTFDNRDEIYYPRSGFLSNLNFTSFPELLDNDFVSNKIDFDFNKYISMRNGKDVLASRVYVGAGIGDLSFQQQFIVGFTDIRGYTQGEYRGDQLYAIQTEYRWNFQKIMSAVAFAGLATVTNSINTNDNGKILPGIGAGFRVNVAPQYHMNVGMDVATGIDDWGLYFRIGEAF